MSPRYLVTGGCGFIGGHLCDRLAKAGASLVVLDDLSTGQAGRLPDGTRLITADICDTAALSEALDGVDGVFHLAAIASVAACSADPVGTSRVNLGGTDAVLAACADEMSVVFASSAAIYGAQDVLPVPETATPAPMSPYASDKLNSEARLTNASANRGLRTLAARPFNVYGPGQMRGSPYSGVLTLFADAVLSKEPITMHGDGLQSRDFIHVHDLVRGMALGMDRLRNAPPGSHQRVNLCTGQPLTVHALADAVMEAAGTTVEVQFGPSREGDIRHSVGDPAHAAHWLGFRAAMPLDAGIAQLLATLRP